MKVVRQEPAKRPFSVVSVPPWWVCLRGPLAIASALFAGCGGGRQGTVEVASSGRKPRGGPLAEGPSVAETGKPGRASLLRALAHGTVEGHDLPPGSRASGGFVDPIPGAPDRPRPRDAAEARARALDDLVSSNAHLRYLGAAWAGLLRLEEAVPHLARLVRKDDAAAPVAVASLGMIGGERAAKALGASLARERDTSLRLRIIRALGATRARSALKPLLHAFGDKLALVRAGAAMALGSLGMGEAAGALRAGLGRKDLPPPVRIAAASALARLGGTEGLVALERAAASASPGLAVVAIRGLAAFACLPPHRRAASRATLPAADEHLRLRAVESIAVALGSPYAEVWSEALRAIACLRPPGALRVLDALQQRASAGVRLRAKVARAAFGGPGARETLAAALLGADVHLRSIGCEILGIQGDPGAVEALSRALDDPHATVRLAAARALGAIGGARAERALERAAAREDAALKVASRRALAVIRWREGRPLAEKKPAAREKQAAHRRATGADAGAPDRRGFRLEKILTGAGGELLCVIREPGGRELLLREGEEAARGYLLERIVRGRDGGGRVFLVRGDTVVTLDVGKE